MGTVEKITVEEITVEEIAKAVEQLPPEKLAKFQAWYEEFAAALFDAQIERDSLNGKLDKLVEKSEADFRAGRFREV
jgi:hypothetical protein